MSYTAVASRAMFRPRGYAGLSGTVLESIAQKYAFTLKTYLGSPSEQTYAAANSSFNEVKAQYQKDLAAYTAAVKDYAAQLATWGAQVGAMQAGNMQASQQVASTYKKTLPSGYTGCISESDKTRAQAACTAWQNKPMTLGVDRPTVIAITPTITIGPTTGTWSGWPWCAIAALPACRTAPVKPAPPVLTKPVLPAPPPPLASLITTAGKEQLATALKTADVAVKNAPAVIEQTKKVETGQPLPVEPVLEVTPSLPPTPVTYSETAPSKTKWILLAAGAAVLAYVLLGGSRKRQQAQ